MFLVWLTAFPISAIILFMCRSHNLHKHYRQESQPSSIRFSPVDPLDYSIKRPHKSKFRSKEHTKGDTNKSIKDDDSHSEADVSMTSRKPLEDQNKSIEPLRSPPKVAKMANRKVNNKKVNSKDPQYVTLANMGADWDSQMDRFDEFYNQLHKTQTSTESCELEVKTGLEKSFHEVEATKS